MVQRSSSKVHPLIVHLWHQATQDITNAWNSHRMHCRVVSKGLSFKRWRDEFPICDYQPHHGSVRSSTEHSCLNQPLIDHRSLMAQWLFFKVVMCVECIQKLDGSSCHREYPPYVLGFVHSHTISLDRSWWNIQQYSPFQGTEIWPLTAPRNKIW